MKDHQIIDLHDSVEVCLQKYCGKDMSLARLTQEGEKQVRQEAALEKYHDGTTTSARQILERAQQDFPILQVMRRHALDRIERRRQRFSAYTMPVLLLILTALAGNWIAYSFQHREFKSNSLHQFKVETLKRGRDEALIMYSEAQQAKVNISALESFGGGYAWYIPVQKLKDQLEKSRTLALEIITDPEFQSDLTTASQALTDLRECLQNKGRVKADDCAGKFDEGVFRKIADNYALGLLRLHRDVGA